MLTDLGVARVLGETAAAEVTPAYVDPTVARGGAPGPASDVFGVAAAAFHALTGIAPWNAATPADTLAVAAAGYLPDLAELAPEAPAELIAVIERGLSRRPARPRVARRPSRWTSGTPAARSRSGCRSSAFPTGSSGRTGRAPRTELTHQVPGRRPRPAPADGRGRPAAGTVAGPARAAGGHRGSSAAALAVRRGAPSVVAGAGRSRCGRRGRRGSRRDADVAAATSACSGRASAGPADRAGGASRTAEDWAAVVAAALRRGGRPRSRPGRSRERSTPSTRRAARCSLPTRTYAPGAGRRRRGAARLRARGGRGWRHGRSAMTASSWTWSTAGRTTSWWRRTDARQRRRGPEPSPPSAWCWCAAMTGGGSRPPSGRADGVSACGRAPPAAPRRGRCS